VIASDSFEGRLDRETHLTVRLYIMDENDNKPIFKHTPYHVDVSEVSNSENYNPVGKIGQNRRKK